MRRSRQSKMTKMIITSTCRPVYVHIIIIKSEETLDMIACLEILRRSLLSYQLFDDFYDSKPNQQTLIVDHVVCRGLGHIITISTNVDGAGNYNVSRGLGSYRITPLSAAIDGVKELRCHLFIWAMK